MATGPEFGPEGRRGTAPAEVPVALTVDATASQPTAEDLIKVLRYHRGSVALTAAFYGRDRRQIYRWLERLGLDAESFREP